MSMHEAVKAGAEYLDHEFGTKTWDKRIDLDRLRLDDGCGCVLGQLYADEAEDHMTTGYAIGISRARALGYTSVELGFTITEGGSGRWGALTRAWKRLIRERIESRRRS